MLFAQISPPEFATLITLLVGMLGGFYAFARFMMSQGMRVQEADREERKEFAKALKAMATASERVASATEKAAKEAKQRNGHLAEMELQSQHLFKKLADRNYDAITHIREQHVQHQVVEHEQVYDKEGEKPCADR